MKPRPARWYWLGSSNGGYGIAHRADCRRGSRVPVPKRAGARRLPDGIVWTLMAGVVCRPCWAREERDGAARVAHYYATTRKGKR